MYLSSFYISLQAYIMYFVLFFAVGLEFNGLLQLGRGGIKFENHGCKRLSKLVY
jgi:hypothetical protein